MKRVLLLFLAATVCFCSCERHGQSQWLHNIWSGTYYITTAYNELREELSSEVFGKPLADLSNAEMQVIYRAIPMHVSELEPKDSKR